MSQLCFWLYAILLTQMNLELTAESKKSSHESPPILNGRSATSSKPIHVRSNARPRARSPRVTRVVGPAPRARHVTVPASVPWMHLDRSLRIGRLIGFTVVPRPSRVLAGGPGRCDAGALTGGNGRRRGGAYIKRGALWCFPSFRQK